MHLQWVIFSIVLVTAADQSNLPATPLPFRGFWCLATYSQETKSYTQIGQIFFYNNGTFSLNEAVGHFVKINTPNGTNGTYGLSYVLTKDSSPVLLNKTFCFWERREPNNDFRPSVLNNRTCTPTYEPDTSPAAILLTRNSDKCRLVDDENTDLVLTNTSFESTLHSFDYNLIRSIKRGVVFFGSSSIVKWTTLAEDFPDYTTLNRGFGGSTLQEAVLEFKRIVYPLEPSALIIYSGENDIGGGATPQDVQNQFRQLIPLIRRFYPNLPIAYISIKVSPARVAFLKPMNETNYLIRNDIENMFPGVTFINTYPYMMLPNGQPNPDLYGPDQEHMNSIGYGIWTRIVTAYLASV